MEASILKGAMVQISNKLGYRDYPGALDCIQNILVSADSGWECGAKRMTHHVTSGGVVAIHRYRDLVA